MYIGSNLQRVVVFIGYAAPGSDTGFQCAGTGFLVHHKGEGYLVTARHVVQPIEDAPFAVRVNQKGKAELVLRDMAKWTYHPDKTVDLAAIPFRLPLEEGFDQDYLQTNTFTHPDRYANDAIGVGSLCYVLGLFQYVYGRAQNLPIAHAGNLALLPPVGERIAVWDKIRREVEMVEACLVESAAIDGASGSPVFARPAVTTGKTLRTDQGQEASLHLLGLFQGAWFAPPDSPLGKTVQAGLNTIVPVGIGIVVPAYKIIELLECDELSEKRKKSPPVNVAMQASISPAKIAG